MQSLCFSVILPLKGSAHQDEMEIAVAKVRNRVSCASTTVAKKSLGFHSGKFG